MEEQNKKRQFGNYELVRRIDVGGMGEVYLARQRTAFGREVAIKIIRSDLVHDVTARKRFLREAEVNAYLKHEHILSLIEFGEEQGRLFFVTPYIGGGPLSHVLRDGPLPLSEVHTLFTALVQAVAYIHRRGVIHRDLKPSNILLDEGSDGMVYVRLIDFGIATIQGGAASPPLTMAGNEMGTVEYMAPERMSGVAAVSNDIFSLGVMLYQMLTGQLPRAGRRTSMLPEALDEVVRRCTEPKPKDRFPTAEELLRAFEFACQYVNAPPTNPLDAGAATQLAEDPAPGHPDPPRPSRPPTKNSNSRPEVMTLQRSEDMPPPRPKRPGGFEQMDYESPTLNVGKQGIIGHQATGPVPSVGVPPRPAKPRRNLWLAIIPLLIVVTLLVIAGLLVFEVPTISTATVNITPKTTSLSQVFTITAKTSVTQVDVATMTIPAKVITKTKSSAQQGTTTGQQCDFLHINCVQTVDVTDESRLVSQAKQSLIQDLTREIQSELQAKHAHSVGAPSFFDANEQTNPPVGTVSKTVTVTLTEEGSAGYFLDADARALAQTVLTRQLHSQGSNYQFKLMQVGQPVVESVNRTNGVITIKVPAAGVAQYAFSRAELLAMQTHLEGLKVSVARSYLQQQPGVDPNTVGIHFAANTNNTTLPADVQHIQIVPINPTDLPPLQLPSVNAATPSPTPKNP